MLSDPESRARALEHALTELAEKIGAMPTRLEPDAHDALCESEYIAPLGDTPCDCQHRKDLVRAALASLPDPKASEEGEVARLREAIDKARRETASDPDNRWCRNATIILNAALSAPERPAGGGEADDLTKEQWKIIAKQRDKVIDKIERERDDARSALSQAHAAILEAQVWVKQSHAVVEGQQRHYDGYSNDCAACQWLFSAPVVTALKERTHE